MHKRIAFFSLFLLMVFMIIPVNFASAMHACDPSLIKDEASGKRFLACFEQNPNMINDGQTEIFDVYAVARSYEMLGDTHNAIYYYTHLTNAYPTSKLVTTANASLCDLYLSVEEYMKASEHGYKVRNSGSNEANQCISAAGSGIAGKMQGASEQTQQTQQQTQQTGGAMWSKMNSDGTCDEGFVPENERCVSIYVIPKSCLIATAAFGSEMAPQVQLLREIRDNTVLQTESGSAFMTGFNQFYYSFSPAVADYERENPAFKEAVKLTLTPLLISLSLLQYADIDSESEMLGYGIGVILLNIGMYFVAPAVLIMKIRKRIYASSKMIKLITK